MIEPFKSVHPFKFKQMTGYQKMILFVEGLAVFAIVLFVFLAAVSVHRTAGHLEEARFLNSLTDIRQALHLLNRETERLLAAGKPIEAAEELLQRRKEIDRLLDQGDTSAIVRELKSRVQNEFEEYERQLKNLTTPAVIEEMKLLLERVDDAVTNVYSAERERIVGAINSALDGLTKLQYGLMGIIVVVIMYAIMLFRSLERSFGSRLSRAYVLLEEEVRSRRGAAEKLSRQNAYLAGLHETSLALINRLDVEDLLEVIVSRACRLLKAQHGFLYLLEDSPADGGTIMRLRIGIGLFKGHIGLPVKRGEGLSGEIWQSEDSLLVESYRSWPSASASAG